MIWRSATSEADPAAVWALLARPSAWSRWAPHIRGGAGLGAPEVQAGSRGFVLIGPGFPVAAVPAVIGVVRPGRSWSWRVAGLVEMEHVVEAVRGGGSSVRIELRAPAAVELGLRVTYAPLVTLLLQRLARVAAEG